MLGVLKSTLSVYPEIFSWGFWVKNISNNNPILKLLFTKIYSNGLQNRPNQFWQN